jgi:hypothetical protein
MNANVKQIFVVKAGTTLKVSGNTSTLAEGQIGVFTPSYTAISNTAVPTPAQSPYIMLAEGTGNASLGSFKTSRIYLNKVTAWRGTAFSTTSTEMEVTTTPGSFKCERTYVFTVRIFEHFLQSVYCPYLQESVMITTPCCEDCTGDCDNLVATSYIAEIVAAINANVKLNPYVVATVDGVTIVLTGKVVPGLTAVDCLPDSVPYIANKVRFKVYAGEAAGSSQLEDIANFCDIWESETTQDLVYPIGEGVAIAELERHFAGYNQPNTSGYRYNIPYYNGDLITFTDKTLSYDIYELEYLDPSSEGFEQKTAVPMSIVVAFPSSLSAEADKFETIMNTWLANSPAYQTAVNI